MYSGLIPLKIFLISKNFLPFWVMSLTKNLQQLLVILSTGRFYPKHREILSNAIGLSTSVSSSMIEDHMVNLHVVVTRIIGRCTHVLSDIMQKNFGLAFCFMGVFLLCSGRPSFVDARAIGIVSQVRDGDNPASLILAKTLLRYISWWIITTILRESLDFTNMVDGKTGHDGYTHCYQLWSQ